MIDAVVGFVALLRRRGLGVGSDRAVLAARALRLVDISDSQVVRRALRLTLLMHGADRERFDELFDTWFDGSPLVADVDDLPSDDVADHESEPASPTVELRASTTADAYVDDPAEQVAVSSDESGDECRRSNAGAAGTADAEVVARFGQSDSVGELDSTDVLSAAERSASDSSGDIVAIELSDGSVVDTGEEFDDLDALRRMLHDAHHERRSLLDTPERGPARAMKPNSVLANPFNRHEQRTLDAAVRAMWSQLEGAPAWRRRPATAGEIDVRRTLRRSVAHGGVPAVVPHRAPATKRPDVLVLVDTSVSMRPSVRLMLHLAHALRRRPGRVRVLGFVDECVDVTDVVRHADLSTALGGLLDDAPGGPLDPARSSDYGTAFNSLWHRHVRLLRPTTTVLVLGDGRSNGRDPGLALVGDLTARCRRTVWCTPEPEGAWAFGNGEMAAYASRVDAAFTVRSLDDLAEAVDRRAFKHARQSGSDVDEALFNRPVVD